MAKGIAKGTKGEYNIIMVGPQGSGKGTQAQLLAKKLGVPHISTGDIFREIRKEDSPLGRQVKNLIDNGNLVPDKITNKVVLERLKKSDVKKGFILDGFPRNLAQADFLEKLRKVTHCILVNVSDAESIRRIGARRICSKCHEGYNTIYIKPKKESVCDKCGAKLVIRDDDKPDAVKLRLKRYHAETEPIIKYYDKKGVLVRINGEQPIEKVFSDIKSFFD